MRDAAAYTAQLQQLLPTGPAWTRDPASTLTAVLAALAAGFARLDTRVDDLLAEIDPRSTYDMLEDWERVLGLPDGCSPVSGTLSKRRVALIQKLTSLGGQTPAYYEALAAALGFDVVIHEFDPAVDTYSPGLDITDGKWRLVWRMEILNQTDFTVFRAGVSAAGDRLVEGGALDLECVIRRAKPAHTLVLFTYPA